jgi:hypothetical protein
VADIFHDRHAKGRTKTGWLDAHHTFSFGSLQLLEGVVQVNAEADAAALELRGGDALQLTTVRHLTIEPTTTAAWLWFDLP